MSKKTGAAILFTGPNQYDKRGQETITLEFINGTEGFNYYDTYFERLWNDGRFCKSMTTHPPENNFSRFYISPILGCDANCTYCYTTLKGYNSKALNLFSPMKTIEHIEDHSQFVQGRTGSVLSIGAWGEIFPNNDPQAIEYSIEYIEKALETGNPVQIITKNTLSDNYVKRIAAKIQYQNQLLFSTSITTFLSWEKFEPGTSSPKERLSTLGSFKKHKIPVNLMIKPYLDGVTNKEIDQFSEELIRYGIDYCVVGNLLWDESIGERLIRTKLIHKNAGKRNQSLGCYQSNSLTTNYDDEIKNFAFLLSEKNHNTKIFRKSSCVHSNLFGLNNTASYFSDKQSRFCLKCDNCSEI